MARRTHRPNYAKALAAKGSPVYLGGSVAWLATLAVGVSLKLLLVILLALGTKGKGYYTTEFLSSSGALFLVGVVGFYRTAREFRLDLNERRFEVRRGLRPWATMEALPLSEVAYLSAVKLASLSRPYLDLQRTFANDEAVVAVAHDGRVFPLGAWDSEEYAHDAVRQIGELAGLSILPEHLHRRRQADQADRLNSDPQPAPLRFETRRRDPRR